MNTYLVDLENMMILSYDVPKINYLPSNLNHTTLDDPLQTPNKEFNHEEWVSLKQCLFKDDDKTVDLTTINQVDLHPAIPKYSEPNPKE